MYLNILHLKRTHLLDISWPCYSGSLTTSWSIKMNIFYPGKNPLPPTLSPYRPLSEKRPLGGGLTTEIYHKEIGNARKHRKSAEKKFQISFLMECYCQNIIIHINSAEHIRSYTCEKQIIFFAVLHNHF